MWAISGSFRLNVSGCRFTVIFFPIIARQWCKQRTSILYARCLVQHGVNATPRVAGPIYIYIILCIYTYRLAISTGWTISWGGVPSTVTRNSTYYCIFHEPSCWPLLYTSGHEQQVSCRRLHIYIYILPTSYYPPCTITPGLHATHQSEIIYCWGPFT